jgi:hypothetical protein
LLDDIVSIVFAPCRCRRLEVDWNAMEKRSPEEVKKKTQGILGEIGKTLVGC